MNMAMLAVAAKLAAAVVETMKKEYAGVEVANWRGNLP